MIGGRSWEIMPDGSVLMSLSGTCVETMARRVQREIVQALLDGWMLPARAGPGLDTLVEFLGTVDFAALRAEHPRLSGDVLCRVRVARNGDGVVCCALEDSK